MAELNLNDLDFILQQILISEQIADFVPDPALTPEQNAAAKLAHIQSLIPNPMLPWGVRTVDGTYNNIIEGRTDWGAADQEFLRLTDPSYRTGTAAPNFDINGPAPGGTFSADYSFSTTPGNVADTAPRTISNLIVDQTITNPAAVLAALKFHGLESPDAHALINPHYADIAAAKANLLTQQAEAAAAKQVYDTALAALSAVAGAQDYIDAAAAYDTARAASAAAAAAVPAVQTATSALYTALVDNVLASDAVDAAALATAIAAVNTLLGHANSAVTALDVADPDVAAIIVNADLVAAQSFAASVSAVAALLAQINVVDGSVINDGAIDLTSAFSAMTADNAFLTAATTLDNQLDASWAAVVASTPGGVTAAQVAAAYAAWQDELDDIAPAKATLDAEVSQFKSALTTHGVEFADNNSLVIPNLAPDEGISASFNSWMTLFGQFFDHGLDLVEKTATTKVYVPLKADDPLIAGNDGLFGTSDDLPTHQRFMVITRTMQDARNVTTPIVDQNQTYTSHASHQVFLREYVRIGNETFATGDLLEGSAGGLANWADVKTHALTMLGIELVDMDVLNVPLLATDEYGRFIRGENGYAQIVVETGLGVFNLVSGTAAGMSMAEAAALAGGTVVRTGHAFLDDIAHNAAPGTLFDPDGPDVDGPFANGPGSLPDQQVQADGDTNTGNAIAVDYRGRKVAYDNELLDRHFITGDGRGNENIGLTAVHHVFHAEHNRQIEQIKATVASGGVEVLNQWLLAPIASVPADLSTLVWNGERLFQAARFATEMQYQHLVFEEFARKVNPAVDLFVFNPTMDINPAIFAEFAHTVYRFGHSMLNETVDRLGVDGQTDSSVGLIEAFLNPVLFNQLSDGTPTGTVTVSAEEGAGAIIRAMTRQVGNEIDEFIVEALRNNLLGLPLDLATVNIARGRETGIPTLNEARAQFFAMSGNNEWLRPYDSWVDFAQSLKHPASVINFIAAYGTHASIMSATTLDEKRDAATKLVLGDGGAVGDVTIRGVTYNDRVDFLNATGTYTGGSLGGLNNIDLWIGGLAEAILPFGGMLGSTFTFVFEMQMENLQNGDRFYYLSRTQGLNFLTELESNSFTEIIRNNTDLGATEGTHLPGEIFSTPQHILEVLQEFQNEPDPVHDDPILAALQPKVVRNDATVASDVNYDGNLYDTMLKFSGGEHVVLGGTEMNDVLIADLGDDTLWGEGGDDYLVGGHGVNRLHGGSGDDIVFGGGDPEFIHGEEGDDVIHAGAGLGDLIFGDSGNDFVIAGVDAKEVFAGEGNDFVLGTPDSDFLLGGEGDDWIEGGEGFDTIAGENSQLFFNSNIIGHDVMFAGANEMDFDAESGDDIMLPGESVARNEGMFGFDWVSYAERTDANNPVVGDMRIPVFTTIAADILRDRFDRVEALSGSRNNDVLIGDNRISPNGPFNPNAPLNEQSMEGDELTLAGAERIDGLHSLLGFSTVEAMRAAFGNNPDAVVYQSGNLLIGGDGSDVIQGNGGDDIIDGDAALNVRIGIVNANGDVIGTAGKMQGSVHFYTQFEVDALGDGYAVTSDPRHIEGTQLDTLMFDRAVDPGNLRIIREIVTDTTPGNNVDIAQYSDIRSHYEIEGEVRNQDGTITTQFGDTNLDGVLAVRHRFIGTDDVENILANGLDGLDRVSNIELLQFADQVVEVVDIPNNAAGGVLAIEYVTDSGPGGLANGVPNVGDVLRANPAGITDGDGMPPANRITIGWQVETAPGSNQFTTLLNQLTATPITGPVLNITADLGIAGLRLRAVASFVDNHGYPEFVTSAATAPVVGNGPVGPDPAAVLGPDLGLLGVEVDGTPLPVGSFGVLEDFVTPQAPFTVTRGDLLANVADPDTLDQNLIIRAIAVRPVDLGAGDVAPGILTLLPQNPPNGPWPDSTPLFTFVPLGNFNGGVTFEFEVTDGTTVVPLEATLEVFAVNDLPNFLATDLGLFDAGATFTFAETQLIRTLHVDANGNPTDVDGDALGIVGQVGPDLVLADADQGTLVDNGDGTWTFTAAAGAPGGVVEIQFQVTDGTAIIDRTATFTLGVTVAANAAAETINGTEAGDIIDGGGGIDTINGLGGNDLLSGGIGNDTVNGGLGIDTAVFADPLSAATFAGNASALQVTTPTENTDTLTGVETLRFAGVDFNIVDTIGTAAGEALTGTAGNDLLVGLGGIDTLVGGGGLDTAVVSGNRTAATFALTGALLQVTSGGSTVTLNGVETLQFADGAFNILGTIGTEGLDTLTGTAASDLMLGFAGVDRLDGVSGADVMIGGNDNDIYVVDGLLDDTIVETATGGTDTVESGFTFSIAAIANVENLTLTGIGAINGTGNALGNVITGNGAANTLTGDAGSDTLIGGLGSDTLAGGANNDTYVMAVTDTGTDTINETGDSDTISVTGGGAITLSVTDSNNIGGNGNASVIVNGQTVVVTNHFGNAANGVEFVNFGGATVAGYALGNSDYALSRDDAGVRETIGGAATILIGDGDGGETLTGGAANDLLFSNAGGDTLNGNGGNDYLDGGAGADAMNGGAGDDTVVGGADNDTITYSVTTAAGALTSGSDFVDGGVGLDSFVLNGDTSNESFVVYSRTAAIAAGIGGLNANTEIVITRNGVVVTELDNIEQITINTGAGPDSVSTSGSFAPTTLAQNTIYINSDGAGDTVDITQQESDHRIVFNTDGQGGTFIGPDRPQDVLDWSVNGGLRYDPANYAVREGNEGHNGMRGGNGADMLLGHGGNDMMTARDGNDVLIGGAGNDRMDGGHGNDTFVFDDGFGRDMIINFGDRAGNEDLLDLVDLGITAAEFDSRVSIEDIGAHTRITIDGEANQTITLVGVGNSNTIGIDDFILK